MWLLRLMADRGLALLDASTLIVVIEERGELRVAASSGTGTVRVRIMPVQGSAARRRRGCTNLESKREPRWWSPCAWRAKAAAW